MDREALQPMSRFHRTAGTVLGVALLATFGSGLWLAWVSRTILPLRDPAHASLWSDISINMVAYSSVSALYLWGADHRAVLRWLLFAVSPIAIAAGAYLVVQAMARPEHFEGYLVLLGLILVTLGTAGAYSTLRS